LHLLLEMGIELDDAGDLLRAGLRWGGGKKLWLWVNKRIVGQPRPDDGWNRLSHSYVVNNLGIEVTSDRGAHAEVVYVGPGIGGGCGPRTERQADGTEQLVELLFELEVDQVRKLLPKAKPKGRPGPKAEWRKLIPPTIEQGKAKHFRSIDEYVVLLCQLARGKPFKVPEKVSDIREQLQKAGVRNSA
jgi:hypothetical protein